MRTLIGWTLAVATGAWLAGAATAQSGPALARSQVSPIQAGPTGKPIDPIAEAKAQEDLGRMLDAWEARCKTFGTLAVKFDRSDTSHTWGRRSYGGSILFGGPELASLEFRKALLDADGKPTGQFAGQPHERIVYAGPKLAQYDYESRMVFVYPVQDLIEQSWFQHSCFPFMCLFRANAIEMKGRYRITLLRRSDREALIRLEPRQAADRSGWEQALIWLDTESSRPNKLRLSLVGGKETQEFRFSGDDLGFSPNIALDESLFDIKAAPGWRLAEANPGVMATLRWLFKAMDPAPKTPAPNPVGPPKP